MRKIKSIVAEARNYAGRGSFKTAQTVATVAVCQGIYTLAKRKGGKVTQLPIWELRRLMNEAGLFDFEVDEALKSLLKDKFIFLGLADEENMETDEISDCYREEATGLLMGYIMPQRCGFLGFAAA